MRDLVRLSIFNRPLRQSLLLPALLLLGLAACTTVRPADLITYDTATDQTTYRSRPVVLMNHLSNTGMTRSVQLTLTAQATCLGKRCSPDKVGLIIRLNRLSDASSSFVADHSILLRFANRQLIWEDPDVRQARLGVESGEGVVTTFSVPRSTLETLAQADPLTGFFAGQRFVASFRALAPLRTFAQTLSAPPLRADSLRRKSQSSMQSLHAGP